jgi:hypothetical protein
LRLIGLLSRMYFTPGGDGCPNCGAACTSEGTPACRFECQPQTLGRSMSEPEGGWLPTPTASSYGSCRGGGAGRVGKWRKSLQSLGVLHPDDWEQMMGFPTGWTDVAHWVTPLCPRAQRSYLEESPLSTDLGNEWDLWVRERQDGYEPL